MKIIKSFPLQPSEDSTLIAEAFGIEDEYDNKILDLEIPNSLPQITYITGESGSGKSTLLRELNLEMKEPELQEDIPLHKWGEKFDKEETETLYMLSLVGLGDAVLFLQYYNNLSDSQKYRAKIAHFLLTDEKTLALDEFLSTLDRDTAKSVAYCIQKAIRKTDKQLIAVTAHSDLIDFLKPNLLITGKSFPSKWECEELEYNDDNPFEKIISFTEEDKLWYRECDLGDLHYKGKYTGGVKDYVAMRLNDKCIGVLISTYIGIKGKEGRRISRVVIHPSYRGIGMGRKIVQEYIKICKRNKMSVDALAVMAQFNPFFEKAGMERLKDVEHKPKATLRKSLKKSNFDETKWYKKSYCLDFCKTEEHRRIISQISKDVNKFVNVGGKTLPDEEVQKKILENQNIAGRVLWFVRPKKYAKYVLYMG